MSANPVLLLLAALGFLAFNSVAEVQVTRFEPPLNVSAWNDQDSTVAVDFNCDGQVDLRFLQGFSGVSCFFNFPTRIVILKSPPAYPGNTNVYGGFGALPLGTIIGSNLVTSLNTNDYVWHWGDTNTYDLAQEYGDHGAVVFGVIDPGIIGVPPMVGGDPPRKEGVMAAEFLIGTNTHYGYVHFDFRLELGWHQGSGGYFLGWAYETEPNTPILATPIAVPPTPYRLSIQKNGTNAVDLTWRATPGATYRVQSAFSVNEPFADLTSDITPASGATALPVVQRVTFHDALDLPAHFWRIVRTR